MTWLDKLMSEENKKKLLSDNFDVVFEDSANEDKDQDIIVPIKGIPYSMLNAKTIIEDRIGVEGWTDQFCIYHIHLDREGIAVCLKQLPEVRVGWTPEPLRVALQKAIELKWVDQNIRILRDTEHKYPSSARYTFWAKIYCTKDKLEGRIQKRIKYLMI